MTTLTATQAKQKLPEMLNRVAYGHERIAIERHGKVVAALVSADDLELLALAEDAKDIRDAIAARKDYEKHGGVTLAEYEKGNHS